MSTTSNTSFLPWYLQPLSFLLGLLDYSFYLLYKVTGNRSPKFFSKGWGDPTIAYKALDEVLQEARQTDNHAKPSVTLLEKDIAWTKDVSKSTRAVQVLKGTFVSPAAKILPSESKVCTFYKVEPISASTSSAKTCIIMLPATGEMGPSKRLSMAKSFAKQYGWTSLIVTAPYYSRRKPSGQHLFFINTVQDILLQSQGMMQETTALIRYCLATDSTAQVCVTGFSWGAAMSANAVALALQAGADGRRIALVPYVGCHSPICLADGVLEYGIDWTALQQDQQGATGSSPETTTRAALAKEFEKFQLKQNTEGLAETNTPLLATIRAVCMEHDHFIRKEYSTTMLEQLEDMVPQSKSNKNLYVQWLPGGHITGMALRTWIQRQAIVAAVADLNKQK